MFVCVHANVCVCVCVCVRVRVFVRVGELAKCPLTRVLVVWHSLLISCFTDGKLGPGVSLHEEEV